MTPNSYTLIGNHMRKFLATTLALVVTALPLCAQDFSSIDTLMADGIKANQLPGGVVLIGHGGKVVFHKAYGDRKVAGEVSPNGSTVAEPMTEDTIFDMASLTKCIATSTAMMQLYEQGKFQFDDPVAKYLPEFAANGKGNITIRQILTHYSGLAPDVSLKDPWGLAKPDKAEGIRRAMESVPAGPAGVKFVYSDINFITAGALVEKLSGESLDVYAYEHVFSPLKMTHTRFHGFDRACGPSIVSGAARELRTADGYPVSVICNPSGWYTIDSANTAPTAHDDELNAQVNPNFDHLLRGTVHDPTTRRMGGVAGHAGVFSTAADVALYAQALLDKLAGRPSNFPLKTETLRLMAQPEQPVGAKYLRGYGWDIDSPYSRPRGDLFPVGSFGHTGFTGTSLWMDPRSNTYVILLANAIHPRGRAPVTPLRGKIATAAAKALGLYRISETSRCPRGTICDDVVVSSASGEIPTVPPAPKTLRSEIRSDYVRYEEPVLPGIDSLEAESFAQLKTLAAHHEKHLNIGLLTNNTGTDRTGKRTIDILTSAKVPGFKLTTLFSPEHGINGAEDREGIESSKDKATGIPIVSLYSSVAARHPKHEDLANLDAVFIDLQDAGFRYYTYEAQVGYFLEAAANEEKQYHHRLDIVILDRPAMPAGTTVGGPLSDAGHDAYTNYMAGLPSQNGMTLGEVAQYFNQNKLGADGKPLEAPLTVIRVQNYIRGLWFDQTGLPWQNPSPNLRTMNAVTLYAALGLVETSSASIGRGTDAPFEQFGAPWIKADEVVAYLNARKITQVQFEAVTMKVTEDEHKYPFHGQSIPGVKMTVTDRTRLDGPALGLEILSALYHFYPEQMGLDRANRLIVNQATVDAIKAGKDPHDITAMWEPGLTEFREKRAKALIYSYLP
ncbi:serine hydrolase [Terriglobus tenax]|uniref:serine hydrolase n=1 Tax=Terriglobus tenax TaxID=1111115 RepID=UPI0021E0B954|nr:serine hydrolase [Terriglobus tenax]